MICIQIPYTQIVFNLAPLDMDLDEDVDLLFDGFIFFTIFTESIQNTTIEERVSLLEIQVGEIKEDVTEVDERVELLEGDVNFLFDEMVIQDERLLELEQTSDQVVVELAGINVDLQGKRKQAINDNIILFKN